MTVPLFVVDLLAGLNLGEQVTVAAVFILFVLYAVRGKKAAGSVVGVMGTAWLLSVGISLALAVAILLGWVDPNPVAFLEDAGMALKEAAEWFYGPIGDFFRDLL